MPISHVMMYLGREKGSGKRIMFGASDGRSYNGVQRWGVSVFDFKMPNANATNPEKAKVEFVGFARIPGLRGPAPAPAPVVAEEDTAEAAKKDAPAATPAPGQNQEEQHDDGKEKEEGQRGLTPGGKAMSGKGFRMRHVGPPHESQHPDIGKRVPRPNRGREAAPRVPTFGRAEKAAAAGSDLRAKVRMDSPTAHHVPTPHAREPAARLPYRVGLVGARATGGRLLLRRGARRMEWLDL
ncbi:MAG: hypothetical protein WDN28_12525 [Chthoniobacter sp.]